jgi:polysaccharide pyruvyl transferase WcaK-like protein
MAMKVTVCGSFGFANVGDEAIPEAIADLGHSFGVSIEPMVVGRYDEPAMAEVIGLSGRDRARRDALRGLPVLASGGGIIDNNPNAVIFRCKELLTRDFATKVSFFGVSVESGVTYDWRCRWRLRRFLRNVDVVYTRDDLSKQTLNSMFPRLNTETIGDLVLWLRPEPSELTILGLPKRYIAVNLAQRWSNDPNWQQWIASELVRLSKALGVAVVFVPMTGEYDDDRVEHRVVAQKMRLIAPETETVTIEASLKPRVVAAIFAYAELVVSMRLHGCVIAYAQQTVCIGLGYHPKLYGFFDTIKLGGSIIPGKPPANQSKGVYGYSFSDLGLKEGDLVSAAQMSLAKKDFSMLPVLKSRSAAAFRKIFELGSASEVSSIPLSESLTA